MKQGWECPKCGRVYSPKTAECFECNKAPKASKWVWPYLPYQPYKYMPWWEYRPVTISSASSSGTADFKITTNGITKLEVK